MITGLDHIAIAVPDLERAIRRFMEDFGLACEGTEENPSSGHWFEGNFASYEENKSERLGPDAARPHRVTYRKLTRD